MSKLYVDELHPKTSGNYVVMPDRPHFLVSNNANQVVTTVYTTAPYIADFTNVVSNVGSHYSTANKKFTVPVDGLYQLGASIRVNSPAGYFHPHIRINNTNDFNDLFPYAITGNVNNHSYDSLAINIAVQLEKNDEVQLSIHDGGLSGGTFQHGQCWFYGYLVG